MELLHKILLAFIPLFVAFDAIGILPIFLGITESLTPEQRKKAVIKSTFTALLVAISFLFVGKAIFKLIGISVDDFMIAGGILLFIIAMTDIIIGQKIARNIDDIGVVPLGVPLIVGPAVLTTEIILVDIHGTAATIIVVVINIFLTALVLLSCNFWQKLLGKSGSLGVSKIASLLLAAIAVMMIRKGLTEIIHQSSIL